MKNLVIAFALGASLAVSTFPSTAVAGDLRIDDVVVHGRPTCTGDLSPVYVARRANPDAFPTDDVTIVEGVIESDDGLPAVRLGVFADLSVLRPGDVRDISKMFVLVTPDGERVPLRQLMPLNDGLNPIRLELRRPLADRFLNRLPILIPLRLTVFEGSDGPELASSGDATWQIVPTGGESIGGAPGGSLIQLPAGGTAVDDAQVAVRYGCETLPRGVDYRLTGVAVRGLRRSPESRIKSIEIRRDAPDGLVVARTAEDVALPAIYIGRRVIDLPDVLVGAHEADAAFFVVLTFSDGLTDLQAHDDALPAQWVGWNYPTLWRIDGWSEFEQAEGVSYAIDLLTDGRLQTAD